VSVPLHDIIPSRRLRTVAARRRFETGKAAKEKRSQATALQKTACRQSGRGVSSMPYDVHTREAFRESHEAGGGKDRSADRYPDPCRAIVVPVLIPIFVGLDPCLDRCPDLRQLGPPDQVKRAAFGVARSGLSFGRAVTLVFGFDDCDTEIVLGRWGSTGSGLLGRLGFFGLVGRRGVGGRGF
jgi:hypothetical protein